MVNEVAQALNQKILSRYTGSLFEIYIQTVEREMFLASAALDYVGIYIIHSGHQLIWNGMEMRRSTFGLNSM